MMETTLVLLKPSCVQRQQNIVHASDSVENAAIEVARFFRPEEIFDYQSGAFAYIYGDGECK